MDLDRFIILGTISSSASTWTQSIVLLILVLWLIGLNVVVLGWGM